MLQLLSLRAVYTLFPTLLYSIQFDRNTKLKNKSEREREEAAVLRTVAHHGVQCSLLQRSCAQTSEEPGVARDRAETRCMPLGWGRDWPPFLLHAACPGEKFCSETVFF
jgi:hypothetical protein